MLICAFVFRLAILPASPSILSYKNCHRFDQKQKKKKSINMKTG